MNTAINNEAIGHPGDAGFFGFRWLVGSTGRVLVLIGEEKKKQIERIRKYCERLPDFGITEDDVESAVTYLEISAFEHRENLVSMPNFFESTKNQHIALAILIDSINQGHGVAPLSLINFINSSKHASFKDACTGKGVFLNTSDWEVFCAHTGVLVSV